jgi:thioredoxin-like negative regulator of GroEL
MYLILGNLAILAAIGLGTWWLTGYDKTASGESKRGHYLTRALRCMGVLFLSAILLLLFNLPGLASFASLRVVIFVATCIGFILRSSISELFTHGVLQLMDPELHDTRPFDPKRTERYLDAIARLIQSGQREAAIELCNKLKQTGAVDLITIENTLDFLGVKPDRVPMTGSLLEAERLRTGNQFPEAERLLKSLLAKNPADAGAVLMLMRLYADDLRQSERAREVLRTFEQQPHAPPDLIKLARRSLAEWSHVQPPPLPESAQSRKPESVEELLAQGSFGGAVEFLEEKLKDRPADFELRLKLAEVYAVHCKNLFRAEKIVAQIVRFSDASSEQTALARAKLAEWHEAAGGRW